MTLPLLPCESVVSLRNPVPADIFPGLVAHLASYLMYITGQVPLMVDPAQEPVSFSDKIVSRQMRQFRASLAAFQERLAQVLQQLQPTLEAYSVYLTMIILFGPSAAAPRRLFAIQIPVHFYSSPPTVAGKTVTVSDYMRVLGRELQGLSITMDLQPYRCYIMLCEDAVITSPEPLHVSLSAKAYNLRRHERRTVSSTKKVATYATVRLLLSADEGAQPPVAAPTVPFAEGVWLLASVRGFATFSNESDQDADSF